MNFLLPLFVGLTLTFTSLLIGGASGWASLANVTVMIAPSIVTLFAGETQTFVATVRDGNDKGVNWAVDEEDGGTITGLGLYTAPKIQGVYHVTATTRESPQRKAVATVTVLVYCDPLGERATR